jgi:hypothetical protein
MNNLHQWAAQWGVPYAAVADLQKRLGMDGAQAAHVVPGSSESAIQSRVRLEAAAKGMRLFRNNVGALKDDTGRVIRYGIANDSPQMNKMIKSSDLIGINPVTIAPEHIGQTIGQFVAREVKAPGWRYAGTDREVAQLRFINMIAAMGGDACFASDDTTL